MAFRDLIVDIDATVFETLSDSAQIEGRTDPVLGMFSAPWKQPQFGKLNTNIREPHLVIRVSDSDGLEKGLLVVIDLPVLDGGGNYDLLQIEPDGNGLVTLILRKRA